MAAAAPRAEAALEQRGRGLDWGPCPTGLSSLPGLSFSSVAAFKRVLFGVSARPSLSAALLLPLFPLPPRAAWI